MGLLWGSPTGVFSEPGTRQFSGEDVVKVAQHPGKKQEALTVNSVQHVKMDLGEGQALEALHSWHHQSLCLIFSDLFLPPDEAHSQVADRHETWGDTVMLGTVLEEAKT